MRSARRARLAPLGALAVATVVSGCAQIPRSGPVVEVQDRQQTVFSQGLYYNPKGPQPGDSPADIVTGFLVAMTATPLQTRTAQQFLTSSAQARWQPQRRVVIYNQRDPSQGTSQVVVRLHGASEVGSSGEWMGSLPTAARRLTFPMALESGQWRISRVPDALIVPRTFYDQEYQEAEVYFLDPSGRILVPEPVHVQQGEHFASALVRALVHGPAQSLNEVERTFLPPGLSLVVSVPVSAGGVADVTLRGNDPGPLNRTTIQRILSQFAWTLRQDDSIHAFRLNIAGRQIADSDGHQTFRVGTGASDPLDPALGGSPSFYYALRNGRLVSGQIDHPTPVLGPFGSTDTGIGPLAVSLDGDTVAGVAPGGLLVGSVADPDAGPARQVLSGTGLLRPAWDFAGRLWEIRNGASGAEVLYLDKGRLHHVRVPGITGTDVRRFLVSRDGSRLVAVVSGPVDRIMISRLRYVDGRAVGGTRARRVPWVARGTTRVQDIGWTTPTTIEVLDRLSRSQSEARILYVDGSTAAGEAPTVPIPGRALGLVTSPVGYPETPYAVLPRLLYSLAAVDAAPATIDTTHLRHITYVG